MKLDLDDLERTARAAKANSPVWCGPAVGAWTRERALINFNHLRANSPDVTLALVARIRELEQACDAHAATADETNARLTVLRTQLAMDAKHADENDEQRSSAFWYTMWTEANRRNAELAVELAKARDEVTALRAQVESRYADGRL